MKIHKLIELLSNYNPDGEVQGIEHLTISSPLMQQATPKPRIYHFLKGQRRIDAATAPGTAYEVAEKFSTTPEYILQIRKEILGKAKTDTATLKVPAPKERVLI